MILSTTNVGDMLAFVFRTMSVESEVAKGLVAKGEQDSDNGSNENSIQYEIDSYKTPDGDMGVISALDVLNVK